MCAAILPRVLGDLARERHERYVDSAARKGLRPIALADMPGDAERVLACSAFAATTLARRPELLHELVSSRDISTPYEERLAANPESGARLPTPSPSPVLVDFFETRLTEVDPRAGDESPLAEAAAMLRLRSLRRREWLRLAWRDLGGLADGISMMREASAFADAAVRFALASARAHYADRLGRPSSADGEEQELVILALGKLGAGELNFSSDIDLIFAYPGAGETQGGRRSLSNHEFFLRLARQFIKLLTLVTEDGSVFRVDMRLRPFGDSGPLVMSFDALEEYYQTHGRDWERYALIRARPLTGSPDCQRAIERQLRPFVYRRYLDFGTLELLREMKRSMAEEVNRRGLHNNVKLGAGGIREVEFTAQAFQMVRGGRVAALRERCLLRVLPTLAELELLPTFVVQELRAGYLFLRATEHCLQQMDDRQLHELPEDEATRILLAAGMGFASWEDFERELNRHRTHINAQFTQVFGYHDAAHIPASDPLRELLSPELSDQEGERVLGDAGFCDAKGAWLALKQFKTANDVRLVDGAGARRLQALLPDLLRAAATHANAVLTLERVLGIVRAVVRRSAYLSLLAERPLGLSQLVKLCSASPWITRLLARHPILLDELLDSRHLYEPMSRLELGRDLASRLENVAEGDTEEELECLRQFKNAAVLRVAASDVGQGIALMRVSDHLTEIAETALQQALAFAWRDLCRRHGAPHYLQDGREVVAPFAVIAYGKLGGIELGYSSDLDLVFVHGGPAGLQTRGQRPIDNVVFFQRLGQRIIHFLSTPTAGGVLYEVDSRLRPSGNKGPLVVRFKALATYLRESAWTWEHQALVRARVVAGDPGLGQGFAALRYEILTRARDPAALQAEVREMRARMLDAHGPERPNEFDLKRGAGGIADIEFVVQYCVLRWAGQLGEDAHYTDNIRLLQAMAKTGLMPQTDARQLIEIFQAYRSAVHTQALQEQPGISSPASFAVERETVIELWNKYLVEALPDNG